MHKSNQCTRQCTCTNPLSWQLCIPPPLAGTLPTCFPSILYYTILPSLTWLIQCPSCHLAILRYFTTIFRSDSARFIHGKRCNYNFSFNPDIAKRQRVINLLPGVNISPPLSPCGHVNTSSRDRFVPLDNWKRNSCHMHVQATI